MTDEKLSSMLIKDKTVLITGGIGSIGSRIVKKILQYAPKKILVLDNRETELFYEKFYTYSGMPVELHLVDVRDKSSIAHLFANVDIVFHAAALKHVPICEVHPYEAVKTNIIGTNNVVECAIEHKVSKFIFISTDKAVNPNNVMGASKLLAERLIIAKALNRNNGTKFGIIRFGNVLYSRGSVLEIWNMQLKTKNKIAITDQDMTRFFMSLSECVDLILFAAHLAENGETFILKMKSIKLLDLAKAYLQLKGFSENAYEIIGKRPGEKKHEELFIGSTDDLFFENEKFYVLLSPFSKQSDAHRMKLLGFHQTEKRTVCSDQKDALNFEIVKESLSKEKDLLFS
ncbi:NAD-dependent epimerase/dehydratase family protein [Candidatus Woesearchaeota archaeon]|nr:MAG: NAD-dependent epimerase/dehydratase family protein [Candidatus Woesearchaeota archaeon]